MIQGDWLRSKMRRCKDLADGLWREDLGASVVEFALIVPFLFSLAIGIVEMSNLFFIRSTLGDVVRDAVRRCAVGALDKSGTEQLVLQKVAETIDFTGNVRVSETEVDEQNTDVTVTLTVPLQNLLLFQNLSGGLVTFGGSDPDMTFSATMLKY